MEKKNLEVVQQDRIRLANQASLLVELTRPLMTEKVSPELNIIAKNEGDKK